MKNFNWGLNKSGLSSCPAILTCRHTEILKLADKAFLYGGNYRTVKMIAHAAYFQKNLFLPRGIKFLKLLISDENSGHT